MIFHRISSVLVIIGVFFGLGALAEQSIAKNNETIEKDASVEQITGAFGIALGERFDPALVKKVLKKSVCPPQGVSGPREKRCKGQGFTNITYEVVPKEVNASFSRYTVATDGNGIVYRIQAYVRDLGKCKEKRDRVGLKEMLHRKYDPNFDGKKMKSIITQGSRDIRYESINVCSITYLDHAAFRTAEERGSVAPRRPHDETGL